MHNEKNILPIAPASLIESSQNSNTYRKKRTRAKRSCDKCRLKKTRCDALLQQPCTKCKQTNAECTFLVDQKKRGPSGGYVEILESRLLRMEKLLRNISKDKRSDTGEESDTSYTKNLSERSPNEFTENHNDFDNDENYKLDQNNEKTLMKDTDSKKPEKLYTEIQERITDRNITNYERTRYIGASSGVHFLNDEILRSQKKYRVRNDPAWFVQKLNEDEEEHVFFKSKQVLSPPESTSKNTNSINRAAEFENIPHITPEFVDYLVHLYFTRIHNYCPVINKVQFLEQYYYQTPSPPDKYVLHAMVYICVLVFKAYIIEENIFELSEDQLDDMTDRLRSKSHKILSFVYKRSMVSTLQALLLLSMFVCIGSMDEEDTSHWFVSGIAIRMAQDLGLHRDCSNWPIPEYEIELRKRLWYSVYCMDRWIAADLGRPLSIIDNEFNVELPSPFELNYQPNAASIYHSDHPPILILEAEEARKNNKPVYSAFTSLVTISQIAGQVLISFHSTKPKQSKKSKIELIQIIDRNLANWKKALPSELRIDLSSTNFYFNSFAGIVNMAYDCVVLLLYRPFIKKHEELEDSNFAVKALNACTSAANSILTIIEATERDRFIALPWNTSVYCLFQATIIFLHNAQGDSKFLKKHGQINVKRCAKIYENDSYLQKNRIIKILNNVISNFDFSSDENNNCSIDISYVNDIPTNKKRKKTSTMRSKKALHPLTTEIDILESENERRFVSEKTLFENYDQHQLVNDANQQSSHTESNSNSDSNTFTVMSGSFQLEKKSNNITVKDKKTDRYLLPKVKVPKSITKTINDFSSTKSEDVFISSLSLSLGKNSVYVSKYSPQYVESTNSGSQAPNHQQFSTKISTDAYPYNANENNNELNQNGQNRTFYQKNDIQYQTINSDNHYISPMNINQQTNSSQGTYSSNIPTLNELDSKTTHHQYMLQHNQHDVSQTITSGASTPVSYYSSPYYSNLTSLQSLQIDPNRVCNTPLESMNQAYTDDMAGLNSRVPLSDIPSGVTWNEWDFFLKNQCR